MILALASAEHDTGSELEIVQEMGDQLRGTTQKIEGVAARADKNEAAVKQMRKKMDTMAK
jgi:hypothetical protein